MTEKIVLKEILTSISILSEKSFMEILEIIEIDNYKKGDIFIQKYDFVIQQFSSILFNKGRTR